MKGAFYMEYRYTPEGVCSREFIIHMDGDIITKVEIIGGCPGNTLAVTHLIEGSNINDVIKKSKTRYVKSNPP